MISDILLALGVVTVVLTLLDILLNEKQKVQLAHWSVLAWAWLDAKKTRYMESKVWSFSLSEDAEGRLTNGFAYFTAIFFGSSNAFLAYLHQLTLPLVVGIFFVTAVGAYFVCWLHFLIDSMPEVATALLLFASVLLLQTPLWLAFLIEPPRVTLPVFPSVGPMADLMLQIAIYVSYIMVVMFSGIALYALAVASIIVFMGVIWSAELVTRRIAEYPKGPALAAGVFFTSIMALIKSFTS